MENFIIEVDSYFVAGTAHAEEYCHDAADGPIGCAECGRMIRKCFVLSDGRIVGGDCAATITGDDSTRSRGEDAFRVLKSKARPATIPVSCWREEVARIRRIRACPATRDYFLALNAYIKADRAGSAHALGAKGKAELFEAAWRARPCVI